MCPVFFDSQCTSRGLMETTYLESPTPLCLFTMQLLWGYDDKGPKTFTVIPLPPSTGPQGPNYYNYNYIIISD